MINEQLIDKIKFVILEHTGDNLISLYVIGSFLTEDMIESSDIDFVGIMKSSYNYDDEEKLNEILNEKIPSSHRIDIGMMSYDEFFGGESKGSIMENINLPVFINFLKKARLIHGKHLNFDDFPIKLASSREEFEYYINTFYEHKDAFKEEDLIGRDFTFRDFIKLIFYIARLELQLMDNFEPANSYSGIAAAFKTKENHIVHYSLKLRKQRVISRDEKIKWIELADQYISKLNLAHNLSSQSLVAE